jgi:hypothetical protein
VICTSSQRAVRSPEIREHASVVTADHTIPVISGLTGQSSTPVLSAFPRPQLDLESGGYWITGQAGR